MSKLTDLSVQLTEAAFKRQGQILPSEKRDHGYFERIAFRFENADEIWAETFRMIMSEMPDVSSVAIRDYLDSKSGSHFGDLVAQELKKTMSASAMQPKMANVKRVVALVFGYNPWMRKHIGEYSKDQEVSPSGTMVDIGKMVGVLSDAFVSAMAHEKRRNWKERDAAMHDVQKAADRLLTASRAWMAQRR
jgi:hypothetical protein